MFGNDDVVKEILFGTVTKCEKELVKDDSYFKIKKIYDGVIRDYLSELKEYPYAIYNISEYQQVIAFECGHVTYFGIELADFSSCDYNDEYYRLCCKYNIVFANLIMNSNFKFEEEIFMRKYDNWSNLFNYCELSPTIMLDCDEQIYNYKNSDVYKIFQYVNSKLPDLNLKERYKENQKNDLHISNNKTYLNGLKHYNELYMLFQNEYLSNYAYDVININEHEKIIIIEKNYILYFYMIGHSEEMYDGIRFKAVSEEHRQLLDNLNHDDDYMFYRYIIQELTYNDLFKYNATAFRKKYNKNITYYYFDYVKLNSEYYGKDSLTYNRFDELNIKYPNLKLRERLDNWDGIQYYYIVYELTYNGMKGIAVTRTTNPLPNSMGRTLIKEYENYHLRSYNAFSFDGYWSKCMSLLLEEAKKNKWENVKRNNLGNRSLLAEKVDYYVVPIMLKDTSLRSILDMQKEVLSNALNDKYNGYERFKYDIVDYKWKSEELMYECVKKVFKNKRVIHQYRPYFLHTSSGQLSYDVFVCGLNIAFEYQGKQHFEPVEIFGGEENFKKQQQRDEIKKKLSEKNNIKLIYINYWENISKELIKEKYEEIINKNKE